MVEDRLKARSFAGHSALASRLKIYPSFYKRLINCGNGRVIRLT